MLEEALKNLTEKRVGKSGTIRSGLDWYPGKEDNEISWAKSIMVSMHPRAANDLRNISKALGYSGMPDMDIVLYLGENAIRDAAVSLGKEEIEYGEARAAGSSACGPQTVEGFQCAIRINASEIRIEIMDEDQLPLGVAVFSPDAFRELIEKAAAGEGERSRKNPTPGA